VAESTLQTVTSGLGVKIGEQVAEESIRAIPVAILRQINTRAGFFLVAKYGTQRSAVNLAGAIPSPAPRHSRRGDREGQRGSEAGGSNQLPEAIREPVLDDQRLRNDICWSVFDV